jgi:hypothetical protein
MYGLGRLLFDQIPPTIPAGLASTVQMPRRLVAIPSKIGNDALHKGDSHRLVEVSEEWLADLGSSIEHLPLPNRPGTYDLIRHLAGTESATADGHAARTKMDHRNPLSGSAAPPPQAPLRVAGFPTAGLAVPAPANDATGHETAVPLRRHLIRPGPAVVLQSRSYSPRVLVYFDRARTYFPRLDLSSQRVPTRSRAVWFNL